MALSEAEVNRRGLKVESSEGHTGSVTVETGVDTRTGEIRSQTITTLQTTDRSGKPVVFRPDAGFDGSPVQSHLMDELLLAKATRALGEQAALDEVHSVLLDPVRLKGWEAFIETAQDNGRKQGQSMAFGVMAAQDVEFVQKKGVTLQSGLLFMDDSKVVGPKERRHSAAGNALTANDLKQLPQQLAGVEQVLWDGENSTLLYVLPDGDEQVTKLVIRFGRLRYGAGKVDDVATAFRVPLVAIRDGLTRGQYEKVR